MSGPTIDPAPDRSSADRGRETQPHDRDEVAESAEAAERLGDHRHRSEDAAGIGTGGDDGGDARDEG